MEFTPEQQAVIDALVQSKLDDQKREFDAQKTQEAAEQERKRLEKEAEYKTLYETTLGELSQAREDAKKVEVDALKTQLLVAEGYSADQIARIKKYVVGDDEASIKASITDVKADISPSGSYVDPDLGNGQKQTPKPADQNAFGRELYNRIRKRK